MIGTLWRGSIPGEKPCATIQDTSSYENSAYQLWAQMSITCVYLTARLVDRVFCVRRNCHVSPFRETVLKGPESRDAPSYVPESSILMYT